MNRDRPYELHHGDALEYMEVLADASVDHVITDPPYSAHVHANVGAVKTRPMDRSKGAGRITDLGFGHMTDEAMARSAHHFARIARRWVLVFTDVESVPKWRTALEGAGLDYVRTGVWIKPGAAPQFSGDRPGVGYESVVVMHQPGRKRWNGGGRHAVWTHPVVSTNDRVHTTQKPEALMASLVGDFTDPGETILDPFAGSGTTGVAALKVGRRFVGVEADATHHATASVRLAAAAAQARLFEAVA